MSVTALTSSIAAARADGNITAEEAKTFTSPAVLGAYTDKDEFQVLTNLAADIKGANTVPKPKEEQSLTKRGVNIGGAVGGTIAGVGAIGVIILGIGSAIALGAETLILAIPAAVVLVGLLAFAGAVVGIGALGGYIHSKIKGSPKKQPSEGPVTADKEAASQIATILSKGVTAKDFVKKGTKIGGIVAGVLGGLGLGSWAVGTLVAAGTAGGAGLMAGFITFFPIALGVLAAVGLAVGIGALAGYIHSKRTTPQD